MLKQKENFWEHFSQVVREWPSTVTSFVGYKVTFIYACCRMGGSDIVFWFLWLSLSFFFRKATFSFLKLPIGIPT